MLDSDGFRPNVGIVLLNPHDKVFMGRRIRQSSWQLPQGGMQLGESPKQAMLRELHEEIGLLPRHVRILGRTRDWLRYEVPEHYLRQDHNDCYKGQKQIWFLLRFINQDEVIKIYANKRPEFDAWRWDNYWLAPELAVSFKQEVYKLALKELERFVNAGHLLKSCLNANSQESAT